MPQVDWVGVIEALYAVEQSRESWLDGVMRSTIPLTACTGVGAILYDASDGLAPRLDFITALNVPPGWVEMAIATHTEPMLGPGLAQNARKYMCASSREYLSTFGPLESSMRQGMAQAGLGEAFIVNGLDASGLGCAIYLLTKTRFKLSIRVLEFLKRVASHMATAYRLQRLVSELGQSPTGEAILDSDGRVLHAEGQATPRDCRSTLMSAVQQYRWARGTARHDQPIPAVDAWKGLVEGRWSLREQTESDGKALIHAVANEPCLDGPPPLSPREQQVAALAGLGRTNKLIAYELGLADATVRVLMARAARKLGVRSRTELLARLETYRKS
jgi:DNA-binding CsgD family transcriptional regulator